MCFSKSDLGCDTRFSATATDLQLAAFCAFLASFIVIIIIIITFLLGDGPTLFKSKIFNIQSGGTINAAFNLKMPFS